jgi:hypothetical protein
MAETHASARLPIFAGDIFRSGPLSFGALRAAPAAGWLVTVRALTPRCLSAFPRVLIEGLNTLAVVPVPTRIFRELYQADRDPPAKQETAS